MITLHPSRASLDECRWASCGPTSVAALLNRPLAELRAVFRTQTEQDTWTSSQQMVAALGALRLPAVPTTYAGTKFPDGVHPAPERCWPRWGIVQIQFRGAWDKMAINHPAQLARSHFVAVTPCLGPDDQPALDEAMVFDINALDQGINHGWTPRTFWERRVAPVLWKDFQPSEKRRRSAWSLPTGERGWWVRGGLETGNVRAGLRAG